MVEPPVENARTLVYFVDGYVAYAGPYRHQGTHPAHTHSFFEIVTMIGGAGVHHSQAGRARLRHGDVILLRPGVWHGYEECQDLDIINCCFAADLLRRELSWTREDPLLGYLLWTGPYSDDRRGVMTTHLEGPALDELTGHLAALGELRDASMERHRGDIVGRLALILGCVARAAAAGGESPGAGVHIHGAVVDAMRLMEARPEHHWTLAELAAELHLAPGYLVRLFKSVTGLPPIAYLSRHRVELAADRLLHTDEPINRIGEAVGWPDQNYFARRFRTHYGMSASAYRARFARDKVRIPKH
ncbi:AraC family transcriptional regulator [Actinoplanes sp. NPDC051633]|uniref:helix-turn-helix transcriptional regulator n=1 Tax=Actinoplanes sp. NPDC051633 TaxID=3155670 RepID=UPI00341B4A7C